MWLLKTEPDTFSIDDLAQRGSAPWDGVRNFQARNFIRDDMKLHDPVLIYHSSCKQPAIVGLGRVISAPFADQTAQDPHSPYFDAKVLAQGKNPWLAIQIEFCAKWAPISLNYLKTTLKDSDFALLRKGCRLSVIPVPLACWQQIFQSHQAI